jgi:hypothetical protein
MVGCTLLLTKASLSSIVYVLNKRIFLESFVRQSSSANASYSPGRLGHGKGLLTKPEEPGPDDCCQVIKLYIA